MTQYRYTCNAGIFKVKLLGYSNNNFVADIELLEDVPFKVADKTFFHKKGDVLHVGHWQVKEACE